MPGKDEKKEQEQKQQEQKQQQDFNNFYFSKMDSADFHIRESRGGLTDLNDPEANEVYKNITLKHIAKAMAYAQIAMKYGKGAEPDDATEEKADKEVETEAERIFNSPKFQAPFMGMKNSEILNMVSDPQKGRPFGVEISYEEFSKRLQEREKTVAAELEKRAAQFEREQQQKARMGGLVTDLENSTQKSIFGKIKSIFVGNSQQYENALGAMKALSKGKVNSPERKAAAKKAIKDYIFARGDKVRDHQYGRDRFDAFMKGLGEIMTPQEFMQCCREVNQKREATYGNTSSNLQPG